MGDEAIPEAQVSGQDFKARSANINADRRMKELQHYTKSHAHENRLREGADIEPHVPPFQNRKNLRAEGCGKMDLQMKKLSKEEAVVPYMTKTGELPEEFREKPSTKAQLQDDMETRLGRLRRMDRFQTRLTWRESMDQSLKRLLVDMDLSRDERLKEYMPKVPAKMDSAQQTEQQLEQMRFAKARCEHLDKIYSWYEIHGMKEARKERKAPAYLCYNPQHPVMPGSMRVAPPLRELLNKSEKPGMGHSMSSPALVSAGSAAAGAPPVSMAADRKSVV